MAVSYIVDGSDVRIADSSSVFVVQYDDDYIKSQIRNNKQRPERRLYIKRRLIDGTYEEEWQRVDDYRGTDQVISWGEMSLEIDYQAGQVSTFNVSELALTMQNKEGFWNVETAENSFWSPDYTYLNRKYSKVRVDCGYKDRNGDTVGLVNVFEGTIDNVTVNEDYTANITVLPYTTILQRYDISDLSMSGSKTINTIIDLIMNQSKITNFIEFDSSTASTNVTIDDTENIEGTYWDVILNLAYKSNSIPFLNGSVWSFQPRTAGSNVFDFKGAGSDDEADIYKVNAYDDEGAERVHLYWVQENGTKTAVSTNTVLTRKYLAQPSRINLDNVATADQQSVLDALLTEWETPKPIIDFSTRFMVNIVKPLDVITLEIFGQLSGADPVGYWDAFDWDDGTEWSGSTGSINIGSGIEWKVLRVQKNIDEWFTTITAEQVV